MKLLIVEDDAISALFLSTTLRALGHLVLPPVRDGATALRQAMRERPDLILMDIHLHGDMDGLEAANRIHECTGILSIFISAHASQDIRAHSRFPEQFRLLPKPVRERDLIAVLGQFQEAIRMGAWDILSPTGNTGMDPAGAP